MSYNKPVVVLVHGFNVRDGGKKSIDQLAPYLEQLGWEVDKDSADYGWWGLLMVWAFPKKKIENRLIKAFSTADMVLTHSNGANFATRALGRMNGFHVPKVVQHFSPALDRDTPVPEGVKKEFIFFSKRDIIVALSKYLPAMPWGSAGSKGKIGIGPYQNLNYTDKIEHHSDWFKKPMVEHMAVRAVVNYNKVD